MDHDQQSTDSGTDGASAAPVAGGSRLARRFGVGAAATAATAAVLLGGLTVAGAVAGADDPPSTTSTTSTTTTTTTTIAPAPTTAPAPTQVIPVPGVGEIVITAGAVPSLVSATGLPGFVAEVHDQEPGEVHVSFVGADGRRIEVQAEFEDGRLRVEISDEGAEDESLDESEKESYDESDDSRGGSEVDRPRATPAVPAAPRVRPAVPAAPAVPRVADERDDHDRDDDAVDRGSDHGGGDSSDHDGEDD